MPNNLEALSVEELVDYALRIGAHVYGEPREQIIQRIRKMTLL